MKNLELVKRFGNKASDVVVYKILTNRKKED
jgi:hypothetical protein